MSRLAPYACVGARARGPAALAIHDATPEENWLGRHFAQALQA
ncbi:MAG TPA: hypothetical protein VEA44_02975 [Caulobacter sp.]|nr:hypothetical protein [Caulobacter sp.]